MKGFMCWGGGLVEIVGWPERVLLRTWLLGKDLKEQKGQAGRISEGKPSQTEWTAKYRGKSGVLQNSEKFSVVGTEQKE